MRILPASAYERFRLLVESVEDHAIFMPDPRGVVQTWNAGAERIKGYRAEEIIGQHFSKFYPPEDVAASKCETRLQTAAREARVEDEGWRVRRDGSQFWASVVITALRNNAGELVGFQTCSCPTSGCRTKTDPAELVVIVATLTRFIHRTERSGRLSVTMFGSLQIHATEALKELPRRTLVVARIASDVAALRCGACTR